MDGDIRNGITAFDGVDDVLAFGRFSEDGVFSVEVRGGAMGDEELGSVGVGSGVGHGEDAGLVVTTVGLALALELVAGASGAGASGAAALDHEVGDDAVKFQAVVVAAGGEAEEGGHGDGCVVRKEGEVDVALVGVDSNFDVVHVGERLAQILRVGSHLWGLTR